MSASARRESARRERVRYLISRGLSESLTAHQWHERQFYSLGALTCVDASPSGKLS